jgi:eukaryotic-like serine/threonine-protein kinase
MDEAKRVEQSPLMQGQVEGRELFELVKLMHRLAKTGMLELTSATSRGEIYLNQGAIVAAFFNDLAGPSALTRAILIGKAQFRFDHHDGHFPHNVAKDTVFVLDSIEKILAEHGARLWGGKAGAPRRAIESEHEASDAGDPETLMIAAFSPPEVGRVIGKCQLEEEIGRGSSAIVYRAKHRSLALDVVVKVLLQGSEDERLHRTMTRNEAQLLGRLNHPNILRIFDFDEDGHYPHLVMEYVDGPSLGGMIGEHGALDADVALPIFCQVAEGLAYAYAAVGMVHCDIKPTNILITSTMQAKVADFGLAKALRPAAGGRESALPMAGTPAYIAPEQVREGGSPATHLSDVYSLGGTFYHALTGRPPFEDADPMELMAMRLSIDPIPPHIANPALDRGLSDLVLAMLARDPDHRIASCEDVLNALTAIMERRDEAAQRAQATFDGNIIRRRSSFWNYVPAKLLRRSSTAGKAQAG